MLEFMRDGGVMMWPLLALGVVAIAGAVRRRFHGVDPAYSPQRLATAVMTGGLGWAGMGLVVVSRHAGEADPAILVRGVGEATCPAVLGLTIFAIVTMIGALPTPVTGRAQG